MSLSKPETYAALNHVIYKDRTEWGRELNKYGLTAQGYVVDNELSSDNTMILSRRRNGGPSPGDLIIVNRGTQLNKGVGTAMEDLGSDVAVAFNRLDLTPRYKKAKLTTQAAMVKYAGYDPVVTGFSLGGSVATHLGHDLGIESHSFNPGVSVKVLEHHIRTGSLLNTKPKDPSSHLYITKGDVISNSGMLGVRGNETIHINEARHANTGLASQARSHGLGNWMPNVATE